MSELEALAERKRTAPKHVDNSSLYAGEPMTYYCRACGHVSGVLPEDHVEPSPKHCAPCASLVARGLIGYYGEVKP